MKGRISSLTRRVAGGLALLLALTFAVPPSAAGEGMVTQPAAAGGVETLRSAADARLTAADTSKGVQFAQAAPTAGTTGEGKPFFKTTKGVAVGVLMVGGLAWMIASRHSDKVVHSPAR